MNCFTNSIESSKVHDFSFMSIIEIGNAFVLILAIKVRVLRLPRRFSKLLSGFSVYLLLNQTMLYQIRDRICYLVNDSDSLLSSSLFESIPDININTAYMLTYLLTEPGPGK